MEPTDAERRAGRELERVPDWIWNGETLPVPVEDIVDSCFGLYVREAEDLRTAPGVPDIEETRGLSGLLLPSLGEIWVSAPEAREWPGRRRFTISHELGHWCLHRTDSAVWCRKHAVDPPEPGSDPRRGEPGSGPRRGSDRQPRSTRPPAEAEADEFAAALLMPAHLIRRHYEQLRRQDDCFQQLCRAFGASGAAMGRRLQRVL